MLELRFYFINRVNHSINIERVCYPKVTNIVNLTLEQIKTIFANYFKQGDKINVITKSRNNINTTPATFQQAFKHFITVETSVNNYSRISTITYIDIFIGNVKIKELKNKALKESLS